MSLSDRFRAYLGSAEFAVTVGGVVVALVAGAYLFEAYPEGTEGYFAVFLAGLGAPNIHREQWNWEFDSRAVAAAWGAVAGAVLIAAFLALTTVLGTFVGGDLDAIIAFAATWILGLFAARVLTQDGMAGDPA
jgi:uncharacterized protein (DUF697 family)